MQERNTITTVHVPETFKSSRCPSTGSSFSLLTFAIALFCKTREGINKGESLQPDGFPSLGELNNKWTHVSLAIRENTASITIGDFQAEIVDKAMQRDKKEITISFASGSFQLRDFTFHETP